MDGTSEIQDPAATAHLRAPKREKSTQSYQEEIISLENKKLEWLFKHEENHEDCILRSFLVINVCNLGKTLCSPCSLFSLSRVCNACTLQYVSYVRIPSLIIYSSFNQFQYVTVLFCFV
jgi:hypothetical protein